MVESFAKFSLSQELGLPGLNDVPETDGCTAKYDATAGKIYQNKII